ncbi:MAG: aldehyde-activating protein [Deltaproteobacteria bacterium]|nr:aldehyde-activating protein [Deltaproteobacteria bacterium]
MAKGFKGGFLCGAVRFESESDPMVVAHCHCLDCRKSSGTGHSTHIGIPEASFRVTGDVKFYDRPADSGNMVSRGFCPTCGSPVYSRNAGMPGIVFARASVLEDPENVSPQMVVYTSRALSWDPVDAKIPGSPEMPAGVPEQMMQELKSK